ncbi:amidohydrolase [Cryptosporangium phraense]|uniref:Amidohydrolase family protein n=1 Tax=Cryptosporangium phraense TaxID=2593070 RepID=A0A545AXB8_9ACTN|nr:amidohydrolase family protein [Cryptosporangium phraense]TQS45970.1 amidohydrolase family protein [Cryptosporangium phraense]
MTLLSNVRLVPVRGPAPDGPVDVRMTNGRVAEVGSLSPDGDELVVEAGGRWLIPGLWDQHVHLRQWAQARLRLDLSGATNVEEAVRLVTDAPGSAVVVGAGFRSATWPAQPTTADLDVVGTPVVLISGDVHTGWLNSAAWQWLGLAPRPGVIDESEWFALVPRLEALLAADLDAAYRSALDAAAALGVVGIGDMEFEPGFREWPRRVAAGLGGTRVRVATYADGLEDVIAAGLRTGSPLGGLVTMGPLKIISDGSLNSLTARCCEPYADGRLGIQNFSYAELVELLGRAAATGLDVALHAIGDAALTTALDAFEATGASGGIEHVQLARFDEFARMARLGLRASVQPAHLLDDRDVALRIWPDRADRCYAFGSMLAAGVPLALGSDAPVSPLDPWLAMAAAVHRSADDREPWLPSEALTVAQALAASVDGAPTVQVGSRADVVLLDENPLAPVAGGTAAAATHLRALRVAATFVDGHPTHLAL